MLDPKLLCNKLAKPWWGPHHPSTYCSKTLGKSHGVGCLVATADWSWGGWNLALLRYGKFMHPVDWADHVSLLAHYTWGRQLANRDIYGWPLGDHATTRTLPEFVGWLPSLIGGHKELRNELLPLALALVRVDKSVA